MFVEFARNSVGQAGTCEPDMDYHVDYLLDQEADSPKLKATACSSCLTQNAFITYDSPLNE
jgi:hypothetical protein